MNGKAAPSVVSVWLTDSECQILMERDILAAQLREKSSYFDRQLSESPSGPIFVKGIRPKVLEFILKFIEDDKFTIETNIMDDWIQLALKANEFEIKELAKLSANTLSSKFIDTENVLKIFGDHHEVKTIVSACEQTLVENAQELLDSPAFSKLPPKAISRFLQMKELRVKSELVLIRACASYSKSLKYEIGNITFRQFFLPYLRLLTLTVDELAEFDYLLNMDERLFLVDNLLTKKPIQTVEEVVGRWPQNMGLCCFDRNQRYLGDSYNVDIVPDELILDLEDMFRRGLFSVIKGPMSKFALSFEANEDIQITRLNIFCPVQIDFDDFFDKSGDLIRSMNYRQKVSTLLSSANFTALAKIEDGEYSQCYKFYSEENFIMNEMGVYHASIPVAKGAHVIIEVFCQGEWFMRDLEFRKPRVTWKGYIVSNAYLTKDFKLEQYCIQTSETESRYELVPKDRAFNIFKSIRLNKF